MIELYHCASARSLRPLWMLQELQLPCRLHLLPFPPRVLARPFLDENPLGTVPLLIDGATRMTESAAICEYLAARHPGAGLHRQPQDRDFGAYLNGLHYGEATLTFPQTLVLRYRHFEPPERQQPQVADDYARWFVARLRAVEATVGAAPWWCGERFSAADVSVGYALLLASHLGLDAHFGPATAAYWQRLQARPALQAALALQAQQARAQGLPDTPAPALRPHATPTPTDHA